MKFPSFFILPFSLPLLGYTLIFHYLCHSLCHSLFLSPSVKPLTITNMHREHWRVV